MRASCFLTRKLSIFYQKNTILSVFLVILYRYITVAYERD